MTCIDPQFRWENQRTEHFALEYNTNMAFILARRNALLRENHKNKTQIFVWLYPNTAFIQKIFSHFLMWLSKSNQPVPYLWWDWRMKPRSKVRYKKSIQVFINNTESVEITVCLTDCMYLTTNQDFFHYSPWNCVGWPRKHIINNSDSYFGQHYSLSCMLGLRSF